MINTNIKNFLSFGKLGFLTYDEKMTLEMIISYGMRGVQHHLKLTDEETKAFQEKGQTLLLKIFKHFTEAPSTTQVAPVEKKAETARDISDRWNELTTGFKKRTTIYDVPPVKNNTTPEPKFDSSMFCEHANECPTSQCPCPLTCACREHMCKIVPCLSCGNFGCTGNPCFKFSGPNCPKCGRHDFGLYAKCPICDCGDCPHMPDKCKENCSCYQNCKCKLTGHPLLF